MSRKVETLEQQLAQQKARIQQLQSKLAAEKRKQETRRKILAGAWLLSRVERGDWAEEEFLRHMDAFLTRVSDRALFGLPPRPVKTEGATAKKTQAHHQPPTAVEPVSENSASAVEEQGLETRGQNSLDTEPERRLPEGYRQEDLLEQFEL